MNPTAQQFLRALRGARSQLAFARRLGYRANPVTDWEHGRRYPTAQETLRIAQRVGVDVVGACERFAPGVLLRGQPGSFELGAWMRALLGAMRISELARRLGRSRPSVSRWLSGNAQPRLHEFLEFVDTTTGRLPDFIVEFVPIAQVPALTARFELTQAAKRLAFEKPWTEGIVRVLETEAYRAQPTHDPHWLAEIFGLSASEVSDCLLLLQQAQVLQHKDGKYAELRALNVDTRGGQGALHAIKAHWARVATERALAPTPKDFFAYNLCSASRSDMARIRELLRSAFRDLRTVVAASTPSEEVALVNLHFVNWDVSVK